MTAAMNSMNEYQFGPAAGQRHTGSHPGLGRISRRSLLGLAGVSAGTALLGGCGDDGADNPGDNVTIDWWHISNTDPMLTTWANAAKGFMAKHPGVTIKITPLENEAFKAKLTTVTQSGNAPSLYSTWGGGALAQQVQAGLVRDLTEDVKPWIDQLSPVSLKHYQVDGKQYALPFDNGMVGFWYNSELFSRAKISGPPATWAELIEDVKRLKAAGITPIALAAQEKWPVHYYWAYLALRIGGSGALESAMAAKNFNRPDLIEAARKLKELADLQPFQRGFMATAYSSTDGQPAIMGNGKAAMELMGQWAPSSQAAYSSSGKGIGDRLQFFAFPTVTGGKGLVTDIFGGGNGFAIGHNAPAQTVDLLRHLLGVDIQREGAASNSIVPVAKGAETAIKDRNQATVAKTVSAATAYQLYLDQAWQPAVGQQIIDSVLALVAGKSSPEEMMKDITAAAQS